MSPVSTEIPSLLPAGLLAGLAAGQRLTLYLDYDGTISEITPDIANAKPVAGAGDLIARMAARPDRFRVVIISGRRTDTLTCLLGGASGITLVGNHGLEILEPGGRRRMVVDPALFMPELDAVRTWLRKNVPPASGLVIEDKHFSVALHYRLADPGVAREIGRRLGEFVAIHTPSLIIGEGKMVIEARPRNANKGAAVRILATNDGGERRVAVYFGDDVTDEDAFYELRDHGVTIKVCAQLLPSWAKYRVASPQDVVAALAEMVASSASLDPA
jgi:trehalose-phosphatase